MIASAQGRRIQSQKNVHNLLSQARRLEEQNDEEDEEGILEVEDELMNYSLKLLKCEQEETFGYDDNGDPQYGVAIIRACPSNSCSDNKQGGCKSGFADLAVPLADFVAAYMEDQADNMQWDDQMNMENFAQCAQYDAENGDGNYYYVGPSCTDDGLDIKLGLFSDAYCSTESSTSFEQISNGWTLPFSDGGLVSDECLPCGYGDNGYLTLTDMCAELYEDSVLKCEEWDIQHYYWDAITEVYRFGQDTTGCKRIGWMDKSPEPFGEWASIFGLLFLVVGSVVGGYYYTEWWKERKFKQ